MHHGCLKRAWLLPIMLALSPSKAICVSKQLCTGLRITNACYTAKPKFSHDFSINVWGDYYTSVRIIFKFLQYNVVAAIINLGSVFSHVFVCLSVFPHDIS